MSTTRAFVNTVAAGDKRTFYLISALFAAIAAVSIVKGFLVVTALPVLFTILLICVFRLDLIALFAVIVTPLSINLAQTSIGIGVSLPSEPLMFGLFLIFWLKVFSEGGLPREILWHPVSVLILIHMGWYFITMCTSTLPIVSVKSTLARYCYIGVFYFMMIYLFRNFKNITRFIWCYVTTVIIVIAYTLINQAAGGFSEESAHTAMVPFYNDHTAYAAVLCFFIPVMFALGYSNKKSENYKTVSRLVLLILLAATILSYTRAAWIGLIAAFGCYLVYMLKMKTALVYTGIIAVIAVLFMFRTQIEIKLSSNDSVSSTDYASHVESIGNISTDDSNVERLNRWACAIRMFKERPIFGFGPGTYMFKYAPFQKYSERSGISTNAGTGGGSHSEYLGPLAEQGLAATVIFILLIVAVTHTAAKIIRRSKPGLTRGLTKGLILGLITYWIHGFLNYFLDTEKASVPFWGFIAAIVAIDLYHRNYENQSADSPAAEQGNIIK